MFYRLKNKFHSFYEHISAITDDKWHFVIVAFDYIYCRLRFNVNYDEYAKYNFHKYKDHYRKNFILEKHRDKFINLNTAGFTKSKYTFYKYIPDLFARELIIAPYCGEDIFVNFLRKHQKIIVKPDRGSLGVGLEAVEYTNDENARLYFSHITAQRPMICEEFIRQHSILRQLNPASVNTIRIVSLLKDDEVEILAAVVKMGAGSDNVTDNLSLGGIGAQIDVQTGIVSSLGRDFNFHAYTHHPISGTQILGLQLPNWDKTIALVKKAHKRLPQCLLYGWDIAITETGADIVEANSRPGSRIMQVMDGVPKGKTLLSMINKDQIQDTRDEYTKEFYNNFKKYALNE